VSKSGGGDLHFSKSGIFPIRLHLWSSLVFFKPACIPDNCIGPVLQSENQQRDFIAGESSFVLSALGIFAERRGRHGRGRQKLR